MPALPSFSELNTLVTRDAIVEFSRSSLPANVTGDALQVVCAWSLSGQYGPGSRVLYYVLVAACVFARREEWLRNACLAAALLFPAIAALHGIVLAAVHVDGAVDMDIYGAFQLCSIGVLAAPITVRLSRTYFYDPGRNMIFLWTGLILAGLLSLTVEFYRTGTSSCSHDDSGNPISSDPDRFPYDDDPSCGLVCSTNQGPFSLIRGGSANNIYVIPAPNRLTFGAATLLAAACCIPAILSLVSMWNKILEINWKTRFGGGERERVDELIEGTNSATVRKMNRINSMIRSLLSVVEVPMFGGAVLAILVIGEWNFFSHQVWYMSEPIASIGGWAPIVGTGLGALGSLYVLLAAGAEAGKEKSSPDTSVHHCSCPHHQCGERPPSLHGQPGVHYPPGDQDAEVIGAGVVGGSPLDPTGAPAMREVGTGLSAVLTHPIGSPGAAEMWRSFSDEVGHADSRPVAEQDHQLKRSWTADVGGRYKVAKVMTKISKFLGTAAQDRFDDSGFKSGEAGGFPEIPGEEYRNRALAQTREQFNHRRDVDGSGTHVLREQHSRSSFTGSVASGLGVDGGPATPRAASPRRPHAGTWPINRTSFELQNPASSSSAGASRGKPPQRQNTLEVPSQVHRNPMRNSPLTAGVTPVVNIPGNQTSPAIVVSPEPEISPTIHTPASNPPTPP